MNEESPIKETKEVSRYRFDQMKYPALFVGIGLLFAAGIWVLSEMQNEEPEITITKPFSACTADNECVVVPYRYCCVEANAVNKRYEKEYLISPDWQKSPKDPDICAVIECRDADLNSYTAQCVNNKCVAIRKGSGRSDISATSTSSVQDWQTYRNAEFGFEVRYPVDWKAYEISKENFGTVIKVFNPQSQSGLDIWRKSNEEQLTVDKWSQTSILYGSGYKVTPRVTEISGVKAHRVDINSGWTDLISEVYVADKDNRILILSFAGNNPEDSSILEQILSTFRFFE